MRLRRASDDAGAIAIFVAILSVVLFAFGAMVVDLGVARDSTQRSQGAADTAALAGIAALYPGGGGVPDRAAAVAAVKKSAFANFLEQYYTDDTAADVAWTESPSGTLPGPACQVASVPSGWAQGGSGTNCILFEDAPRPLTVRVVLPSARSGVFLGGVVGYEGITVSALAEAAVNEQSTGPDCVFCILGTGSHSFNGGVLDVSNGDLWINGDLTLGTGGAVRTTNAETHVQGSIVNPSQVENPKEESAALVADPLDLSAPDTSSLSPGVKTNPCSDGPGHYGGFTLGSVPAAACTLDPGLYVFTEPLRMTGSRDLVANGVTLYFACGAAGLPGGSCSTDSNRPTLEIGGSGQFTLTASSSGNQKGLAIIYDRGNTETLSVTGGGISSGLSGTIYGPDATFRVEVPACAVSIRSMVVIADMQFGGGGDCLAADYVVADNVTVPPTVTTSDPGLSR